MSLAVREADVGAIGAPVAASSGYRAECERTIRLFESLDIAVLPSRARKKGTYVTGWPDMPADEAIAVARRDARTGRVALAGRTGDGYAVLDLDAKTGSPAQILAGVRELVGDALVAVVETGRGYHVWVRVCEPVGNGYCSYLGGEVLSDPHLAMLPPSVHPEGPSYRWIVEPRATTQSADLAALGLVPDAGASTNTSACPAPVAPDVQGEFETLMKRAGVVRMGARPQTLTLCPWHDDREPSLSVNWDAAVFYCFSTHCGQRGGIVALRRLLGKDTHAYRQWIGDADDHNGDKSGCVDLDVASNRLADGYESLGMYERARAVRGCRRYFRVGKCTACARTPAHPISCSDPLCVRCMPGRLAADWGRHRGVVPELMTLMRLTPRHPVGGGETLRVVRSRFSEWRRRSGITAGIYGVRLDPECGAAVLLALPAGAQEPASTKALNVEVIARNQSGDDVVRWLQREYVDEATAWGNAEELADLLTETRGRRRFQGFGAVYGKEADMDEASRGETATSEAHTKRSLRTVSGGGLKGKGRDEAVPCSFCGGVVDWYSFSVPVEQVERMGDRWLWRGPRAPGGGGPTVRSAP